MPVCAWLAALLLAAAGSAVAGLPPEVAAALQQAGVPAEAMAVVVREVGAGDDVLAADADRPSNPASLTKLVTTLAALETLGPAWTWSTPVWISGALHRGVLDGDVHIRGSGDPDLVLERVWLLLQRMRQHGVRDIRGDIVLDNAAFAVDTVAPADFDGEPARPYNVQPSALLLNHKAVRWDFIPDPAHGVARVLAEPAVDGVRQPRTVPLAGGGCGDWQARLDPVGGDRVDFRGVYPASCGERQWWRADPDPATYNARLLALMWRDGGGRLGGRVREGAAPAGVAPTFALRSPTLAEIVRSINKHSNNVMAQQLFYTLDLAQHPGQPATAAGAQAALRRWLADSLGGVPPGTVIDNGSGLSRLTRLSPRLLARLLQRAWDGPLMPELVASLPIAGVDGTLRAAAAADGGGRAYLKTGTLRDVTGIAGYVLSASGRRYVVVAIVEHPNAGAARPALAALVQWTLRDAPGRRP